MSRSSGRKTDSKRYFDWLYYSYEDLLAARLLINDKRLCEAVIFHCQQAIEKALKGFMLLKQHKLYDGHNITWLCKQAALIDGCFTEWIPKTTELNRFYIETRYPADIHFEITGEYATATLSYTEDFITLVCSLTKFDYKSYHKRIRK